MARLRPPLPTLPYHGGQRLGAFAFRDKVPRSALTLGLPATFQSVAFSVVNLAFGSSPYTVLLTDYFIGASASAGAAFILNLPAATGSGRVLVVKKMDANAKNVAVTPNGADTIDGVAVADNIANQYVSRDYIDYAAGAWAII